ncbi:AAA family ATPase [Methyloceanibacter caenitepidi]|uniref:Exonuclease SbcC n=1 Tax=Methyloceanibacter caenitepidi TaxID=1384459 RepID=A0A0A8K0X3_9HYPH|nr:SMC family ATPase [Methyloceanibacter caenitepidi]BAQ16570.1 exonuclease SbcC [Methyloceanibacter caenitepidi]
MRPVRLTLQAFGPYPGKEVIDFRDAVEAGLFGIYGQTGSGKSTVFSAMTFALFGEPAKPEQETPSLRSDHADADMQTEVELVFDMGGHRYVVARRPEQMRPKQRGVGETRHPHEAFLFDATGIAVDEIGGESRGKILAEKRVRDVDKAIIEMLGYGPEQFRQIVLLPQGKFEAFLAAKTKERLAILRDLFDVSAYRALSAKLKSDADTAERHVQDQRRVCSGRLGAEGFESLDALNDGIDAAGVHCSETAKVEEGARAGLLAAQTALGAAEKLEEQFKSLDLARETLAVLEAGQEAMDALAKRIVQAERARILLDVESNVSEADADAKNARHARNESQRLAEMASAKAKEAVTALEVETQRAGEMDEMRQNLEALDRHKEVLEKSTGLVEAVDRAREAKRQAGESLESAERRLAGLDKQHQTNVDAIKAARQAEVHLRDSVARLEGLKRLLSAATNFEKAEVSVQVAHDELQVLTSTHANAARAAHEAKSEYAEAERALSEAQALHLAAKLEPGEPCPVCGSIEHPAPATGAAEHAGLDQAFRDTKAAFELADAAVHEAFASLEAGRVILAERQGILAAFDPPRESAAVLTEQIETEQLLLEDAGPPRDIAAMEADGERLAEQIREATQVREECRDTLGKLQASAAAEQARLDQMLSAVPQDLRDPAALAATRQKVAGGLAERQAARDAAEAMARETRDADLSTAKDLQAAAGKLTESQARHRKAEEAFAARLAQAGVTEDEFRALKPAIATVEEDRTTVNEHRRKLENANEEMHKTSEAIQDRERPDLSVLQAAKLDADQKLTEAVDLRSGAQQRLAHLSKLKGDLEETLRELDALEASSGPLRALAALANGENPQRLDLETFAIGAMFDRVLEAANLRLGPMTGDRYRLMRNEESAGRGRRGLEIEVFDIFTGKARPTSTLSGGETFIAALALALGLADVVESASGKVRLDTIFIDEGFGSLDTENGSGTLDQVLQVLAKLVSQNRAVGLISHVSLVQEAIPNGFYVWKEVTGSHVEARGVN